MKDRIERLEAEIAKRKKKLAIAYKELVICGQGEMASLHYRNQQDELARLEDELRFAKELV